MLDLFLKEAGRVILGKESQFKLALACLLAEGHLLLEDEPGMGKTSFAKVLAKLCNLNFKRIQFTSDLLPSDITGISIYDRERQEFIFQPGPIFAQLVLGDELNRASPKTQSAFLQAMEEQAVSVDGKTHRLQTPFFFIATQNPRKSIGTFPLPESQLDRFLMKMELGYPSRDTERLILTQGPSLVTIENLSPIFEPSDILDKQIEVRKVYASPKIIEYVVSIAQESRRMPHGLSPRASLALLHAARAYAWLEHHTFVAPEHVQAVAPAVMSHRLCSGDEIRPQIGLERTQEILRSVTVP